MGRMLIGESTLRNFHDHCCIWYTSEVASLYHFHYWTNWTTHTRSESWLQEYYIQVNFKRRWLYASSIVFPKICNNFLPGKNIAISCVFSPFHLLPYRRVFFTSNHFLLQFLRFIWMFSVSNVINYYTCYIVIVVMGCFLYSVAEFRNK